MSNVALSPETYWKYSAFASGKYYRRQAHISGWDSGGSIGKRGGFCDPVRETLLFEYKVPSFHLPIGVSLVVFYARASFDHRSWSTCPPCEVEIINHTTETVPDKQALWTIPRLHKIGDIPPVSLRVSSIYVWNIDAPFLQNLINAGVKRIWVAFCRNIPLAQPNTFGVYSIQRFPESFIIYCTETPSPPARVGIRWESASQFRVMWTDLPELWKETWIVEKEVDQSGAWTRVATIREGPEYWGRFWVDTAIHLNRRYRYRVASQVKGKISAFTYSPIMWSYPLPTASGLTDEFWTSRDGVTWAGPYTDLAECRRSQYLKWRGSLWVDPSLNPDAANFSPALFSKQILYRR